MGRFQRSLELAKASGRVLRSEKELVLLPIISLLASAATAVTFLVPIWLTRTQTTDTLLDGSRQTHTSIGPVGYVLFFLMYVALAYVTIFFNTALITAADDHMRGGNPNLKTALAGATSRAGLILPWAIVSATVSVILRSLEQRAGLLGRLVIGAVGMAWTVITFLVLPIIVFERLSVGKAVKRSASLFKGTWGENLIGNGGIGLVSILAVLAGVPVLLLCIATKATPVVIFGIALFALWVLFVSAVTAALTGVYSVALYRYATDGQAPAQFAHVDFSNAFQTRGGRGRSGGGPGQPQQQYPQQPPQFGQPQYPPPGYGQPQPPQFGQPQYPPPGYGQPPGPDAPGWGAPPSDN